MRSKFAFSSLASLALLLGSCGGGGGSNGGGTGGTPPTPIAISSGTTASVAENSTGIAYQLTTTGGSGAASYTLSGTDAALFDISATGALTFKTAPDFEQPADGDRNNTYLVTIRATDSTGAATRDVTVTVTNVADLTAVTRLGGFYTDVTSIAAIPGQSRLFVAQRSGNIFIFDPAANASGTGPAYLPVNGSVEVRGIAPAPDYATSGTLYVSVFETFTNNLEVRRYGRTTGGTGDAASADVILRIPYANGAQNSGGWIGFGSDNLLYVATGNGASFGANPAVPNTSLLGKVLRIDPSRDDFAADTLRDYGIPSANPFATGGGGAGEVYAGGFREPRSGNLDGTSLYVSDRYDTGISGFAYLYLVRPADAGRTFAPPGTAGAIPPVLQASNNLGGSSSIVAGAVYRGPSPDLTGRYVFEADGGTGANNFFGLYSVAANSLVSGTTLALRGCCTSLNSGITAVAFTEDSSRNLYLADTIGNIYAIQYR